LALGRGAPDERPKGNARTLFTGPADNTLTY
jgi:hypothetical protein